MPKRKPIIIVPAISQLRVCLFQTAHRKATRRVLIQYTHSVPDPRIDVTFLDMIHARAGHLGFRGHFLIRADASGTIEQGRPFLSRASLKQTIDTEDTILILVVGGRDEDGNRVPTIIEAQQESLDYLLQLIANYAQRDIAVTDLTAPSANEMAEMREEQEELEDENNDDEPDEHGYIRTAAE